MPFQWRPADPAPVEPARQREPATSTVFHEAWWLEAVTGGTYRVVEAHDKFASGCLPFVVNRRWGLSEIRMPTMSYVLGPAFSTADGYRPRASQQAFLIKQLVAQLPKAHHISFRLHDGLSDTLTFDTLGFSNTAEFTAEVLPAAPEMLWRRMKDKTRNVLRRAQEQLSVVVDLDAHEFCAFFQDNLNMAGCRSINPKGSCISAIRQGLQRGAGRIVATRSANEQLQSAIFTVWDQRREYFLFSTRRPHSHNGAISLALWTALQHAAASRRTFDLAGIHVRPGRMPNLNLAMGFGGVLKPRYTVRKTAAWLQSLRPLVESRRKP